MKKKRILQVVGWIMIAMGMFSIKIIDPELNLDISGLYFTINLLFGIVFGILGGLFAGVPDMVINFVESKNKKQKIDSNV